MTLERLFITLNAIDGMSGKTVYRAWPEGAAPALPFICYREIGDDNFAADNHVYAPFTRIAVELYTEFKDSASEAKVEAAIENCGTAWTKEEYYLDDERCYEIVYEFEI